MKAYIVVCMLTIFLHLLQREHNFPQWYPVAYVKCQSCKKIKLYFLIHGYFYIDANKMGCSSEKIKHDTVMEEISDADGKTLKILIANPGSCKLYIDLIILQLHYCTIRYIFPCCISYQSCHVKSFLL